jgi:L-cysteine/cystine lyase
MIDVERVRRDLPSVREAVYLNAGTFGPVPVPVRDAMVAYVDDATTRGRIGHAGIEVWLGAMERARAAFAHALQADPDDVALTHAATDGINLVLAGLDWQPGDEVITTDAEHPGITTPLAILARRRGVVVRVAPVGEGDAAEAVERLLTDRTRLVALSHVLWTSGAVLPVAAIAQRAHDAGALVLIDGAQSVGAIPTSVAEAESDFYAVPGQKWLCGPSGTGALHVRTERLATLEPAWPWFGTEEFPRPPGAAARLWPNARRFDAGTVSIGALAGIAAAVDWRGAIGWPEGFERAADLAERLRGDLASRDGVRVVPADGRGTLVTFALDGQDPVALGAQLEEQGVLVRSLPGTDLLRASVGFWNDDADLDRLLAALDAA